MYIHIQYKHYSYDCCYCRYYSNDDDDDDYYYYYYYYYYYDMSSVISGVSGRHRTVSYFHHKCFLCFIFQTQPLDEMNFLRNRLVILGLVLSATVLLYLLLPSIRHGVMEPSLDVQKMGLAAASPPPAPAANMSIRTGQLPGDPPLFFREALPIDASGRQILPR